MPVPWWKKRSNIRKFFVIVLAAISLFVLYLVRDVAVPFLLALVLFYLLNPIVDRIELQGVKRTWAILIVYLAVTFIVSSVFIFWLPQIMHQLNRLLEAVPTYAADIEKIINNLEFRYSHAGLPNGVKEIIDSRIQWLENRVLALVNRIIFGIISLTEHLFGILLAPVIAFYMLRDAGRLKEDFFSLIPVSWQNDVVILFGDINHVLNSYVRGYLYISTIVALLTGLGMFALGIEFALLLGLFAGLTELIPYFGPFIGALPAVLLALSDSHWLALKVIAVFLVIQQLEGSVISPKILGDKVGLHPIAVIASLLVGGKLFGLPGMIMAVPMAAIIRILISFILYKI